MKIQDLIAGLTPGELQSYGPLQILPLFGPGLSQASPVFSLLDNAIEAGSVEVREVSTSGTVGELHLLNSGATPVLLVDGEELVGAKQNRILNLSVLAAAGEETLIPVSCVEQGRWSYRSARFSTGKQALFVKARARKAFRMADRTDGTVNQRADQGEIWMDISSKLRRMSTESETEAMSDGFEAREADLEAFEKAFQPLPGQLGAVFILKGRGVGLEYLSSPEAFSRVFRKVLRSYAIDADEADMDAVEPPALDRAMEFLSALSKVEASQSPGVGLGKSITLLGKGVSGAGLVHEGSLIHMAVFEDALAA